MVGHACRRRPAAYTASPLCSCWPLPAAARTLAGAPSGVLQQPPSLRRKGVKARQTKCACPRHPRTLATQHNPRSLHKRHQHLHMNHAQPPLPWPLNLRPCIGQVAYKNIRFRLNPGLQLPQLGTLQQHLLTLLKPMSQTRHNPVVVLFCTCILCLKGVSHLSASMLEQPNQLLSKVGLRFEGRVQVQRKSWIRLRHPREPRLLLIQQ